MRRNLCLCLLLAIAFSITKAQTFDKELDSLFTASFPLTHAGCAVMVVKNDTILYQKGFGLANLESKEKITPATNFRMASVSKQFTAMCIMLLENRKKLKYTDNLLKFFPNFNSRIGKITTIQHLLTHSSGIKDYEELIPKHQQEQILDSDVLRLLEPIDEAYFEAGTSFRYSNSGFCLLALVVEKVSGLSFAQFIHQNIFTPLQMTHSFIYEKNKTLPNRAFGYASDVSGQLQFSDQSITSATKGDGCVYTSLIDYYKWYKALVHNKFVDLEKELGRINYRFSKQGNYGLGWFFTYNSSKALELYHTGSTSGFSNSVAITLEKPLLILYFSNIANNHRIEVDMKAILKKYKVDDSEIDFVKMLSLTN